MNKNKVIRHQQLRLILYNLIAFTLLFGLFGAIVFGQMRTTLFAKPDRDLTMYKSIIEARFGDSPLKDGSSERFRFGRVMPPPSPRIIPVQWDAKGEITNIQQIGMLNYENYGLENLKFDPSTIGVISNLTLNGTYHFRTLTVPDPLFKGSYIQLLVDVDTEHNLLGNFKRIIIICAAVFILLSITASIILSRKTMKPVIRSWEKQVEFVENASHELRTPLTIIQNKLELLQTMPDKKIVDTFENIALSLSETRRLSRLTTDLLTLARADSTETQLEKQPVDIDDLIHEMCSPYIEIAELSDKHIWFRLTSKARIQADPARLHQLMVILLDNALKYTGEHDSIGISTYIKENRVFIEVSDTGIGISEEGLQRVFDRFYREDRARTRESGGSGLGLSIAQWIVHSHHGTIQALHNHPKGVIIRIRLPK
ncbi:sensor histidine kinase [Paenibacillus favisporus]|uniref:sensor histidine kinase n=1 Tax=Paenibacillus favisporus TaxID=221028 RepID=UPI003D28F0E9